jgi:hypothetical protein
MKPQGIKRSNSILSNTSFTADLGKGKKKIVENALVERFNSSVHSITTNAKEISEIINNEASVKFHTQINEKRLNELEKAISSLQSSLNSLRNPRL